MITLKVKEGTIRINHRGEISKVMAEATIAVKAMSDAIGQIDPKLSEMYKKTLVTCIENDFNPEVFTDVFGCK